MRYNVKRDGDVCCMMMKSQSKHNACPIYHMIMDVYHHSSDRQRGASPSSLLCHASLYGLQRKRMSLRKGYDALHIDNYV